MKRVPFRFKIIVIFVAVQLLFLGIIIIYNYHSIQKFTKEIIDDNTKINQVLIQEVMKTPVMMYDLATLDDIVEKLVQVHNIDKIKIFDSSGKLLSGYDEQEHESDYDENHQYLSFELFEDDIKIGSMEMVFDLYAEKRKIQENTNNIIKIALFEVLLSFIISYWIGRRLSQNLNILDGAVKNMTMSNIEVNKLNINSGDEFEDIANSFNIMQERINLEVKNSEQKNLQLLEQSKLASMGEMIGNIAHQWRQPLSAISSTSTSLIVQKNLDILDDKDFVKACNSINDNAQYLSKTIDDFRNFIRIDKELTTFTLNEVITSFLNIVDGTKRNNNINVILDINDKVLIQGHANELIQCFINIFNNAKDAYDKQSAKRHFFISADIKDDNIEIILKDNAGGIPKKILPQIFEPYFTTKHQSKGTGLGLSMVYTMIVDGMKGTINVNNVTYEYENEEYKGAEFIIILPLNQSVSSSS